MKVSSSKDKIVIKLTQEEIVTALDTYVQEVHGFDLDSTTAPVTYKLDGDLQPQVQPEPGMYWSR